MESEVGKSHCAKFQVPIRVLAQNRREGGEMSTDNTIAVLVTRRRDGKPGNEYRVAHVMALENIRFHRDYPSAVNPVLNREMILSIFGDCQVYYDPVEAREVASKMEEGHDFVEYGIEELDYSKLHFPATERKRKRRRKFLRFATDMH